MRVVVRFGLAPNALPRKYAVVPCLRGGRLCGGMDERIVGAYCVECGRGEDLGRFWAWPKGRDFGLAAGVSV